MPPVRRRRLRATQSGRLRSSSPSACVTTASTTSPTRRSRRTAPSISTPPPASGKRSWRRPKRRASTSSQHRADQHRADRLPLPIRRGSRSCLVATASVPMAASSPSGNAKRTRPRSCCSSKEVAPVGTPKRARSRRRIRRPTPGTRRMRIVRFAVGSSTGPIRTIRSPTTRSSSCPTALATCTSATSPVSTRPRSPSSTTASSTAPRR
jgi:hypothetical protein